MPQKYPITNASAKIGALKNHRNPEDATAFNFSDVYKKLKERVVSRIF